MLAQDSQCHLTMQAFIVSDRVALADLFTAAVLGQSLSHTMFGTPSENRPLVRFRETVTNHPKVKVIYGPIEYIEKATEFCSSVEQVTRRGKGCADGGGERVRGGGQKKGDNRIEG